jgi:hypothetical protein
VCTSLALHESMAEPKRGHVATKLSFLSIRGGGGGGGGYGPPKQNRQNKRTREVPCLN